MTVIEYVTEEVSRQGHDVTTLDGIERVGWMLNAWSCALQLSACPPTLLDAVALGRMVEPHVNSGGIRTVGVRVGPHKCPPPHQVPLCLEALWARRDTMAPLEFYRAFLEVHPFGDGNGRTAKILLNWLAGSLLRDPIFPPNDFWGRWITNP